MKPLFFLTAIFISCLLNNGSASGDQLQSTTDDIGILSWNLNDFGQSKTDSAIVFIATTVQEYDIVMIQEVVAGDPGGVQAVGRLAAALNRSGTKWDYRTSDPTSGINSYKRERYAFLWKTARVSLQGNCWLEKKYQQEIDREPFYATFKKGNKQFTLVNFHAITKNKQPETEVKYFKLLPATYPALNLVFGGDFNLPSTHTVFNPLRSMGYQSALQKQKTSLKQKCDQADCLASEFDHFFYSKSKIRLVAAGALHFYRSFDDFEEAREISDHVPVWMRVELLASGY